MASLLLILVAVTLLVLGLGGGSSGLLTGSIVASLLAAVALVVGARQAATIRAGVEGGGDRRGRGTGPTRSAVSSGRVAVGTGRRQPAGTRGSATTPEGPGAVSDEPAAQPLPPVDAALIALLATDVLVIDGRPRYHLPNCSQLAGQECESLAVREAVELGFTPCGRCEPDSALLADIRRG